MFNLMKKNLIFIIIFYFIFTISSYGAGSGAGAGSTDYYKKAISLVKRAPELK